MFDSSFKKSAVPTFEQLQQSGQFHQWCQWSEDDWKNVPSNLANEEDYLALQNGSIIQRDPETLLEKAQEGDLFAMSGCLPILFRQEKRELLDQYVQRLLQARFFFFLNGFVADERLQTLFNITLPKAKALELIMQDAPTRHPFEQFMIGSSFLAGNNGFEQDLEQGIYYLTLSSRGGCMHGMSWLGNAYANGMGVERDVPFAIRCIQMTYDRGLPNSAFSLGLFCLKYGTEEQMRQATAVCMPYVIYEYYPENENVEKGLRLLREARDAGDEDAARILNNYEANPPHCPMAVMYQKMTGLPIEFSDK